MRAEDFFPGPQKTDLYPLVLKPATSAVRPVYVESLGSVAVNRHARSPQFVMAGRPTPSQQVTCLCLLEKEHAAIAVLKIAYPAPIGTGEGAFLGAE